MELLQSDPEVFNAVLNKYDFSYFKEYPISSFDNGMPPMDELPCYQFYHEATLDESIKESLNLSDPKSNCFYVTQYALRLNRDFQLLVSDLFKGSGMKTYGAAKGNWLRIS